MKSIAIIGSSPIMLILANLLMKKANEVIIYDINPRVGGAWSYYEYEGSRINTQTNVIVPANKEEEKSFNEINDYLRSEFDIEIKEDLGENKPLGYLSKKNYLYDLQNLFLTIKNFQIIKKKIDSIHLKDNIIHIDNKKYDKIFIPYFGGVEDFYTKNQHFKLPYNIIISEHVLILAKKIKYKKISYSENFDEFFDRIQIRNFTNFSSFTARVRREHKGTEIDTLINNSEINKYLDGKLLSKLFKYRNFYRSEEQINKLKKIDDFDQVNIINTFQFFEGFLDLKSKFL